MCFFKYLTIIGLLYILANGLSWLRLCQHDLVIRKGEDPVIMLGWFVCPSVSMVTTSKAGNLEKRCCLSMMITRQCPHYSSMLATSLFIHSRQEYL